MRETNITYSPETDQEFPWNVGLYDTEKGDPDFDGYILSVGAIDRAEAERMSDDFISGRWDGISRWTGE